MITALLLAGALTGEPRLVVNIEKVEREMRMSSRLAWGGFALDIGTTLASSHPEGNPVYRWAGRGAKPLAVGVSAGITYGVLKVERYARMNRRNGWAAFLRWFNVTMKVAVGGVWNISVGF